MSLLWIDGFDSYGNVIGGHPSPSGVLSRYYIALQTNTNFNIGAGRVSGYCLEFSYSDQVHIKTRHLGNSTSDRIIVGFGHQITGTLSTLHRTIAYAYDQLGRENCSLELEPDGTVSIYRGSTLLVKGTVPFVPTEWNYIEWDIEIADSASTSVRVNGTEILSASGIDTKNYSDATHVDQIGFTNHNSSTGVTRIDDLYILNKDSTGASDFLGPCIVETIRPSGDAGTNNWTTSSGVNHYEAVDDTVSDDDTTYVYTDTTDAYDVWDYQNITSTPSSIYGVAIKTEAREDMGGSAQISSVIDSNGTIEDGTSKTISVGGYLPVVEISELNPDTSTAWTTSSVIAAKFGVKYRS